MPELLTIEERLLIEFKRGVISLKTVEFFMKNYRIDLLNEICKN